MRLARLELTNKAGVLLLATSDNFEARCAHSWRYLNFLHDTFVPPLAHRN